MSCARRVHREIKKDLSRAGVGRCSLVMPARRKLQLVGESGRKDGASMCRQRRHHGRRRRGIDRDRDPKTRKNRDRHVCQFARSKSVNCPMLIISLEGSLKRKRRHALPGSSEIAGTFCRAGIGNPIRHLILQTQTTALEEEARMISGPSPTQLSAYDQWLGLGSFARPCALISLRAGSRAHSQHR